jgi:hypothetical protein
LCDQMLCDQMLVDQMLCDQNCRVHAEPDARG